MSHPWAGYHIARPWAGYYIARPWAGYYIADASKRLIGLVKMIVFSAAC